MTTVPITASHPSKVSPPHLPVILTTSFIMVYKRKDLDGPAVPRAPVLKKPRLSPAAAAAARAATPASAPKPLAEIKIPAHTTMTPVEVNSTKKNPSHRFGKPLTNEGIVQVLDTCLNGFPLHSLVPPEAAKLYESVKVSILIAALFPPLMDLES